MSRKNQIKFAVGLASAVVAFLLAQPEGVIPATAKVLLGALAVGLTFTALQFNPRGE